jgi:hypothetical protein
VRSRNLENEEAKFRYRAVKIQPHWVVTPGKQTTINEASSISEEITHRIKKVNKAYYARKGLMTYKYTKSRIYMM